MSNFTWLEAPDPFVWWQVLLAGVSFSIASLIIGVFGLAGGVIYVPTLLMLPGVDAATAVGTTFVASIPMTTVRSVQLQYYGRIRWKQASPLMAGASVGAVAGQFLLTYVSKEVVMLLVALVALFCAIQNIVKSIKGRLKRPTPSLSQGNSVASAEDDVKERVVESVSDDVPTSTSQSEQLPDKASCANSEPVVDTAVIVKCEDDETQAPANSGKDNPQSNDKEEIVPDRLSVDAKAEVDDTPPLVKSIVLGVLSGFISSVGGLGGPVVIVPLYLTIMPPIDMKRLLGLTSPTASVIVWVSCVTTLFIGTPDVGLGLIMSAVMIVSILIGGYLQEKISSEMLKEVVCWLLLCLGTFLIARVIMDLTQ